MSRALARAAALWLLAAPAAGLEVPFLAGRVTDNAEILSPEVEARIEDRLSRLEAAQGSQIAVLTIPSLEGDSLERFSLAVAETWGLGRADADDGALLLISRDDRQMRIEVGYGLESILTDVYSRRILDEVMRPRFRAGDFDGGVERAVEVMADLIEGNDVLPPPEPRGPLISDARGELHIGAFVFFLLVITPFALGGLNTPGCGGWLLYVFLMPFWFAFPAALLGLRVAVFFLGAWIVGFPFARALLRARMGSKWGKRGSLRGRGGWISSRGGGFSSGGFSGGGFSGGGFSGGGGSFGGGGSSSGW